MAGICHSKLTMRFWRRQPRRTSLIIVGCIGVLLGLGLSRKLPFSELYFLPAVTLLPLSLKRQSLRVILAIALGMSLGWWRGSIFMQKLAVLQSYSTKSVTVQMTAATDAIYAQKSQLEFDGNKVVMISPHHQPLAGTFKVSGFGPAMVYKGDRVVVSAKLYPMRGARQARMAYAKLEITGHSASWQDGLRRRFAAGMQNALPDAEASLGLGLLIGQRSTLSSNVVLDLTAVGLVHIVAVSGYNVTILARAVPRLKISRSKFQQLALSLILIGGFVLVTGFSASIVRAAIVSLLSLWAWYYGRKIRPLLLIFFTAAITALYNPFYIWSDLGWYLSFLAFFGVLVMAPLFASRITKLKNPGALVMLLLETFSAELATLPLILSVFGQLSLVSVLANALIVPLVPLAMLLAAFAAAAGALIPFLAGWIAWPAKLLLTYMLDVIHLLASLPYSSVVVNISTADMVGLYALVLGVAYLLWKRSQSRNSKTQGALAEV